MKLKPLADQVVVIVGASSGIGRATALEVARRGAKVVAAARDEEALDTLVHEIAESGGHALAVVADVASMDDMNRVAAAAVTQFAGIDSWVHCAGIAQFSSFEDTTPEEYRRIMEVNFLGNVHGAKAALPHLRQRGGGALVHVTSVEALRAMPLQSAYSASKYAIAGFIESIRTELRHDKVPVAVTNIMPSAINTPLFEVVRSKLGRHPMAPPPYYPPESVARLIAYACEHPSRDLISGGVGKLADISQRISPSILDALTARFGIWAQKSHRPNVDGDNFYAPVKGWGTVKGNFTHLSFRHSTYNYLQINNPLRRIAELLSRR